MYDNSAFNVIAWATAVIVACSRISTLQLIFPSLGS